MTFIYHSTKETGIKTYMSQNRILLMASIWHKSVFLINFVLHKFSFILIGIHSHFYEKHLSILPAFFPVRLVQLHGRKGKHIQFAPILQSERIIKQCHPFPLSRQQRRIMDRQLRWIEHLRRNHSPPLQANQHRHQLLRQYHRQYQGSGRKCIVDSNQLRHRPV